MKSIERRIAKVEERICPGKIMPQTMHVVLQKAGQSKDDAIGEYEAEHPGVNVRELMADERFEISPVMWVRAVVPPWQKEPWLHEGISTEQAYEDYHRAQVGRAGA